MRADDLPLAASRHRSAVRPRRRRSLRRALTLDCSLHCDSWAGAVVLTASDVSDEGLWIDTPYVLSEGEELVVSFALPGTRAKERIWAMAEVARVGMWRRRDDAHAAGMGLSFTYWSERDRQKLRMALRGRPPPLPAKTPSTLENAPPPLLVRRTERASLPAVLDWLLASE